MEKNKIIIFSPHFDDAVFSGGGMMLNKLRQGDLVSVVTVFSGKPNYNTLSKFSAAIVSRGWTEKRTQENKETLTKLKVKIKNLGYLDAIFRRNDKNKDVCASWSDVFSGSPKKIKEEQKLYREIKKKCENILAKTSAEVYFPLSLGNHIDHAIINQIGREIDGAGNNLKVFFYEDLPYASKSPANNQISAHYQKAKIEKIDIREKLKLVAKYECSLSVGDEAKTKIDSIRKHATTTGQYQETFWQDKAKNNMKSKQIIRVVLTGGPLAGKSSTLAYLKKHFGRQIEIMPEIPTNFKKSILKHDAFYSDFFKKDLNKFFYAVQEQLEELHYKMAQKNKCRLVVFDRGLLDGAAYFPGSLKDFLLMNKTAQAEIYKRYDAVIWLETLLTTDRKKSLAIRPLIKNEIGSALKVSENNLKNWRNHPDFYQIKGGIIGEKKQEVLRIINLLLGAVSVKPVK